MPSPDRPAHPGPVRDFVGYGPEPPDFDWPGGARLAVYVGLNIEHFLLDKPSTSITPASTPTYTDLSRAIAGVASAAAATAASR